MRLIARTPQALDIVRKPRIDAVGLKADNFLAAFDNGKEKAIVVVQIPSMNTQL